MEAKTELPPLRQLVTLDTQGAKTLEKFNNEPMVEIYMDPCDETDYMVHNADGSITRVAKTVNINGIQWIIPAGEKHKFPTSVYEHLKYTPENSRLMPTIPMNQSLGCYRDGQWEEPTAPTIPAREYTPNLKIVG